MNPLATEFTPSTSPETRVSQLASRSPQRLVERSRRDSRSYFQQESIGSAPTVQPPRPRLEPQYRYVAAPDGNTPLPDSAWGRGAHDHLLHQHHPQVGHHGWQEAVNSFPEALLALANQGFALEAPYDVPIMATESNERNTRPALFTTRINFRSASGVGEADSGSSHTTESLAHSRSAVTQWTPAVHQCYPGLGHHEYHELFFAADREPDGSTAQTGAATSASRPGYMLTEQLGARITHHLPQQIHRQESEASEAQQMPFPGSWKPQLGPDVYHVPGTPDVPPSLDLEDQDWPPLRPSTARVGSASKRPSQREPSTRRVSRWGGAGRHRPQNSRSSHQFSGDEDEEIPSESRLNPRSERESSHEWPSQLVQQQHPPRPARQASLPIPTVSTSTESIRVSDPASFTLSHSQTQVSSVAALDPRRAALADTAVLWDRKLATQRGPQDHQNRPLPPKHNQRSTSHHRSKTLETLASDRSRDWTGEEFRSSGALHALEPEVELNIAREAAITQRPPALPRPFDEPRSQDAILSRGHQSVRSTSQLFDAQMVSSVAAAPREVSRTSGVDVQSRTRASAEPGSWTNSKRWMSQEMKERQAFSKMMNNLRHMGAERSPCIPQTMTELAALRAELAEEHKKQLTRAFKRRIAELELRRELLQSGSQGAGPGIDKLLWGRRFQDGASPIFASDNCFNEELAGQCGIRVDWPSLAELKEEGERRGGRYRRCLPLPRLNAIDPRILAVSNADVFHPDGTIRWQAKAVSPNRASIMPVSPPETHTAVDDTFLAEYTESKPRFCKLPGY